MTMREWQDNKIDSNFTLGIRRKEREEKLVKYEKTSETIDSISFIFDMKMKSSQRKTCMRENV